MIEEIWKPINNFADIYEISNIGRVRTRKYRGHQGIVRILHPAIRKGYYQYCLLSGKRKRNVFAHRLVAEHFIENPNNKPCIDHINGDKSDNSVSNLRWVTHKENNNNPNTLIKLSNSLKGRERTILELNRCKKPVIQYSISGVFVKEWDSITDASKSLNIQKQNISKCCNHKRSNAGSYVWRFKGHEYGKEEMV